MILPENDKKPEPTREQLLAAFPDYDSLPPRQQRRCALILKNSPINVGEVLDQIPPEFRRRKMFSLVN